MAGVRLSRAGEVLESGKLSRALKGRRFRGHHSRLERERLLILHRRVRAHYVASFPCKALATPVMFLAFVALPGAGRRPGA